MFAVETHVLADDGPAARGGASTLQNSYSKPLMVLLAPPQLKEVGSLSSLRHFARLVPFKGVLLSPVLDCTIDKALARRAFNALACIASFTPPALFAG